MSANDPRWEAPVWKENTVWHWYEFCDCQTTIYEGKLFHSPYCKSKRKLKKYLDPLTGIF